MSVVVSIEDLGACQKEVKVSVPAPAVEAETTRVASEYRKHARIPGFRKGKVPLAIVKKHFGDDIEHEVVERLVPRYWKQAEAESSLTPLLAPELANVEYAEGEDLVFVARVDLKPDFELGNVDSFDLPDPDAEPADGEVNEALEDLRLKLADWAPVERPAANGDRVTVAIELLDPEIEAGDENSDEGAEKDGESDSEPQVSSFEVGDPNVWEELSLAATGLGVGQSAEFSRPSVDHEDAPPQRFRIEVRQIEEPDLAPLDDEFAGKLGEFETLAELEGDVRKNLRRAKVSERHRQRRQALLTQLAERHPFELPPRVVDEEVREMMTGYARDLAMQGVDVEEAEVDWQKMGDDLRPQAEARVRVRLVLDRVVERFELAVPEEELEATLAAIARSRKKTSGQLRQELDRNGRLVELREQLLHERAIKKLLGDEPREIVAGKDDEDGAAGTDESE